MIKYADRRNTNAYKWDKLHREYSKDELLPLWVADMDYETPDCIKEVLHDYVEHPLGYFRTPDLYFDSFIDWERKYENYEIKKEWIEFAPGVVPGIAWVINAFTAKGDVVILNTPVYHSFIEAIRRTGRTCIQNDLIYKNNTYYIDFGSFEKDIIDNNVKLFILCNPANPVGRVWTKEELKQLLAICKKHNVFVISDEIHQDFIDPALPYKKTSAAIVGNYDDILVTMTSASKAFNLGGVQNAFVVIPNEKNRKQFVEYRASIFCDDGNGFGYMATMAAFAYGRSWFEEVNKQIYKNRDILFDILGKEELNIGLTKLEGTYLAWLDFNNHFSSEEEMKDFFENKCGLALSYGRQFGGDKYKYFIRLNLATSEENIKLAANKISENILKK